MDNEHKHKDGANLLGEISEDETWLNSFSTPGPSQIGIERTKQAMRQELARFEANTKRGTGRSWGRGVAVAAVAVLALAVTATWLSSRNKEISVADADAGQTVEPGSTQEFAILESWSSGRTETIVAFSDAMTDLETWSSDSAGDWDAAIVFDASQDDATEGTEDEDNNENGDSNMSRLWPIVEQSSEEA